MHGFEPTLVHSDHAGPGGHVRTSAPSVAESHVLSNPCRLDEPIPASAPTHPFCVVVSLLGDRAGEAFVEVVVPRLANRAVLAAFSVLRL